MTKGEKNMNNHRELFVDLMTGRSALKIILITEAKPNLSKIRYGLL